MLKCKKKIGIDEKEKKLGIDEKETWLYYPQIEMEWFIFRWPILWE